MEWTLVWRKSMLACHPTTEEEKILITEWKYEGEYSVYNAEPYEEQKKKGFGFANPQNHFYSFYDEKKLIGFINLYEEKTEVFFGIGVKPEECGKGYGSQMTETACKSPGNFFRENRCIWKFGHGTREPSGATKKRGFILWGNRSARQLLPEKAYFII